jgi:beta-phosphoglucomutase-like phosphatase (HAD superfamily)
MIKGILFDFDGTIVDSEISRYMSINYILENYHIEISKKDWDEKYKSLGTRDILDEILVDKKNNLDLDILYSKSHRYRERYEKENGVPLIEGFKEFHKLLVEKNIKMLVCSGGTKEHLDHVMDIVEIKLKGFGRESYLKRKPEPDCFIEGLEQLELEKEMCIVFEDSRTGIIAANKVGIKVIAINCSENISDLDVYKKYNDYTEIDINDLF